MATDNPAEPGSQLEQAIQAIQSGERQRGRALLAQVLSADPKEARAWLWLAACWDEADKKRYCLEKALALRPNDPHILQALEGLPASSGSTPVSPEDVPAQPDVPQEPEPIPTPAETEGQSAPATHPQAEAKPAAKPKQAKRTAKPKPRQSAGVRFLGGLLLALLSLLALASIALLVFVLLQLELPPTAPAAPQPPPSAAAGEIPVFQLPATWTPTPASSPSPTESRPTQGRLTLTSVPSATGLPSITPFTPSFDQWRIVIGQSAQGRSIEVFRFGLGSRERMIIAGMHGTADGDSVSLADQMIAYLQANPRVVPEETTLYILRLLNPDAMAASGRFNANGVDLNRNFAENWKSSWEGQGCLSSDPVSAGTTALSETETQALTKFLAARQVELLVNYRSGGQGAYPGGQPADPESLALAQAIAAISNFSSPPPADDCEYTGLLIDWAAARGVQAAVDLAAGGAQDLDFETNLEVLNLLLTWDATNATPAAVSPSPTINLTTTVTTTATLPASPTSTVTPTLTNTASPSPTAP